MGPLLYIPWFRLEPIEIPLAYLTGAILLGSALAAFRKRWRQQATSIAIFVAVASVVAFYLNIDPVPIQPFGILVVMGVTLGTRLAERYGASLNIDPYYVADFATHIVSTGFVFAVVLNAIFYEFDDLIAIFQDPVHNIKYMGISSYGGFVGAMIGIAIWRHRRKHPTWALADTVAFGFPLGWIFGRSGCFVVHDHPGAITDFFLAVENYYGLGEPRHDLGFYEIIYAAIIMAIFVVIRHRWPVTRDEDGKTAKGGRPMGLFVALMPLLYTPGRFFLDTLRATDVSGADIRYAGFTPAQYASSAMLLMSIGLLVYVLKSPTWIIPKELRIRNAPSLGDNADAIEEAESAAKNDAGPSAKRRKKKKSR